ncbi:MAG: DUF3488 domain-containing protein [Candidatus Hydrogenedentes bacterium]|nr:DUF3488 domain-containing protein [Candidatus Hydrogenedentota bacterium]
MPRRVSLGLRISTAALVVAGHLALATTPEYGPALLVLPAVLLLIAPAAERFDARHPLYRWATSAFALFYGASMLAAALAFSLLNAVTWLTLYIVAHKVLHQKSQRDYYQIVLMTFFLVVCACAQDPGPSLGLAMALFLMAGVWSFFSIQVSGEYLAAQEGRPARRAAVAPDILPMGASEADAWAGAGELSGVHVAGSVAGLSVGCVALALGLFLVTPRMEAGLLGRSNRLSATTGVSSVVDVSQSGRITPDPAPIMRVEFPDEPGGQFSGELFWRVTSFDTYIGTKWDCLGTSQRFADRVAQPEFRNAGRSGVVRTPQRFGVRAVRQVIYLDDAAPDGLPCLPYALRAESAARLLVWDPRQNFTVRSPFATGHLQYDVVSEVLELGPDELRAAPADYRRVMPRHDHFVLTSHSLEPETVALVQAITADAGTVYDQVMAVREWFAQGGYAYSLDVPQLPRAGAIDAFINDVKTGHCELYATAMALMLRSIGIPARVASGYRGGEWSERDGGYIVRKSMAHLWVEVYFIDIGWVTFDPSPPGASFDGGPLGTFAQVLSRYILNAKMVWYRDIISYRGRIQVSQLRNLALGLLRFELDPGESSGPGGARSGRYAARARRLLWPALALCGVGAVALAFRRRGRRQRGPRALLTPDQARALHLYRRLKRRLERHGADCRGKTAGEILADLQATAAGDLEAVACLVETYNAVRFGGAPLPPARYRELARQVRALRAASA